MPKLLKVRAPDSPQEEATIQNLDRGRHAPMDIILRTRMIVASWEGQRTAAIAQQLACHPQTVRERLHRYLHCIASRISHIPPLPDAAR